ncbi:MAG: Ig-like domain-containing protein [Gallionellaceae bacterium]|nr:Ig-like domain-containing protein [Gallionellaceae bacterium]
MPSLPFSKISQLVANTLGKTARPTHDKLVFETLEPRILLSGDLPLPQLHGSLDVPGEVDCYSFTLENEVHVIFDAQTNSGLLNWSLSGPRGNEVSARAFNASDGGGMSGNPVLDLLPGAYTLTVDASGDATGSYDFRLLNLDHASTISPGTAISGILEPGNETTLYQLDVSAGDHFLIDWQTTPANARWRLIDPWGRQLVGPSPLTDFSGSLLVGGSYTLLIEGAVTASMPSDYAFTVQHQGNTPPPAPLGQTLNLGETIYLPQASGQWTDFHFTVGEPGLYWFDVMNHNWGSFWTLTDPRGVTLVSGRSLEQSDLQLELNAPGTYQLRVSTDNSAYFRLLDVSAATLLTPGATVTTPAGSADKAYLYRLPTETGQRLYLDTSTGWTRLLLDPWGRQVSGWAGGDADLEFTPTWTGDYILAVASNSASFTVRLAPDEVSVLTLGATTSGAIDQIGERDIYTFNLAQDSLLFFDTLMGYYDGGTWTLTGPNGTWYSRDTGSSDYPYYGDNHTTGGNPVLAASAGDYRLTFDTNDASLTTYSFRLLDLAAAAPLAVGQQISGSLASDTQAWRFSAQAGERYRLTVSDLLLRDHTLRLIDPNGLQVARIDAGLYNGVVELPTLGLGGIYTLLLDGANSVAYADNYAFRLEAAATALTPWSGTPVALGQTISSGISVAGEVDDYVLSLATPAQLLFDVLGTTGQNWTLFGPTGLQLDSKNLSETEYLNGGNPLKTLLPGSYLIRIGGGAGNYSFRLLDANHAPLLTPGAAQSGTLSPGNSTAIYRYQGQAGQRLYLDQLASGGNVSGRLIDPHGQEISRNSFADVDAFTLSQTGTYTLLVMGALGNATNVSYSINAIPVPVTTTKAIEGLEPVTEQDLMVAGINVTADDGIHAGGEITVAWRDTNVGGRVTTGNWRDRLTLYDAAGQEISDTWLVCDDGMIAAGEARQRQVTLTLPAGYPGAGELSVAIWVDADNALFERNAAGDAELNNRDTLTFTSTPPANHAPTAWATAAQRALSFDGVNDYVALSNASLLTGRSAFTIEAWVEIDDTATVRQIYNESDAASGTWLYLSVTREEHLEFGIYLWPEGMQYVVSNSGLIPGWHHVAATFSTSQGQRLYIDGKLDGELGNTSNPARNTQSLLGAAYVYRADGAKWGFFQGGMDEVRLWSVARDQAQLQATMNQALTDSEAGLLHYWQLNEASGGDLYDRVSSGAFGQLGSGQSAPAWSPADTPLHNTVTTWRDTGVAITLSGADVDGDALTYAITRLPSQGTLYQTSDGVTRGDPVNMLVSNPQGQVIYVPAPGASGRPFDDFAFVAYDGQTASTVVEVGIDVTNDLSPDLQVTDVAVTAAHGYWPGVEIDITWQDFNAGNQSVGNWIDRVILTRAGTGVVVAEQSVAHDAVVSGMLESGQRHDGHVTLQLPAGHGGIGEFIVTVITDADHQVAEATPDGSAESNNTAWLSIQSLDPSPTAYDDSAMTDEDSPGIAIDVLANDSDPAGQPLQIFNFIQADHGSVELTMGGQLLYRPDADYFGLDHFLYTIGSNADFTSTAHVLVMVNPVNDTPLAVDEVFIGDENTQLTGNVLSNDSDADGDSLYAYQLTSPAHGSVTLNPDGNFSYTPEPGWSGEDRFTYQAHDGSAASNIATVTLTIRPVNDAPVAINDTVSGDEDTVLTGNVLSNDTDADGDNLLAVLVDAPTHGSLALNADGSFSYTPEANWHGGDRFTYQAHDGSAASNVATVNLTINPVNDAPVALEDTGSTPAGTAILLDVLANDHDVDGDTLGITSYTQPTAGQVGEATNGRLIYTPNPGYSGEDSFTYTVADGHGGEATATVTIQVQAPVFDPRQVSTSLDGGLLALYDALPELAQGFDLSGLPGFDLPLLPEDLASVFNLRETLQRLDATRLAVQETVAGLIDALAEQGIEVVAIEGGFHDASHDIPDTPAPGDLILLRYRHNLAKVRGEAGFSPATLGLLDNLPAAADFDGNLDWQGELSLDLEFGADTQGFFLLGDSRFALDLAGGGEIHGAFPLLGQLTVEATGTAGMDRLSVALTGATAETRYRAGALAHALTTQDVDGGATLSLDFALQPIALDWSGQWTITVTDNVITVQDSLDTPCAIDLAQAALPYLAAQWGPTLGAGLGALLDATPWPLADMVDPDAGVAAALDLAPEVLSTLASGELPADWRDALATAGFEVEHILNCQEVADLLTGRLDQVGDLVRLRYHGNPQAQSLQASHDFDAADIGGLAGLDLQGQVEAEALARPDIGFGLDLDGFFVTADSALAAEITGTAEAIGSLGGFAVSATGTFDLTPELALSPLDGDSDGKLRGDEFADHFDSLSVDLGTATADLTLALDFGLLDYVDADGDAGNNTAHGGDPFRFAAATTLNAALRDGQGVRFDWGDIEPLNPDVDQDGTPDFTAVVLAEDVARLVRDIADGQRLDFLNELLEAFRRQRLPLSSDTLAQALHLAEAIAQAIRDHTEVLYLADFATVAGWLNGGLPGGAADIVRLRTDLAGLALDPLADLDEDFSALLDSAVDGRLAIENTQLRGDLVYGLDTADTPLYLLLAPDAIRPDAITDFGLGYDLSADLSGLDILDGAIQLDTAGATLPVGIVVGLSGPGKLRLGQLPDHLDASLAQPLRLDFTATGATLASNLGGGVRLLDDDPSDDLPALYGHLDLTNQRLDFAARQLLTDLGGVVNLTATGVDVIIDAQADAKDNLLHVDNAVGRLDALTVDGKTPTLSLDTFGLHQDGSAYLSGADLNVPTGYTNALGIAGFLPLEVTDLNIAFPNPDDLDAFRLGARGRFLTAELDALLPFTPYIKVGGVGKINAFDFSIDVASLSEGRFAPDDFGPITLGVRNLRVPVPGFANDVLLEGEITLGGYEDGVWQSAVEGFLSVVTDGDDSWLDARIDLLDGSTLGITETGADLNLHAKATLSAAGGSGQAQGVELTFGLVLGAIRLDDFPYVRIEEFNPSFKSVSVSLIEFTLADFLKVTATDLTYFSNPTENLPIASGNATIEFLAFPELDPLTVTGFHLYANDRVVLDDLDIPISGRLGELVEVRDLMLGLHGLDGTWTSPATFNLDAVTLTALGAALLPDTTTTALDGKAVLSDGDDADDYALTGRFDVDGQFIFSFDTLHASVPNVFDLSAQGGGIALAEGQPLLSVDAAQLTLPLLEDELTFGVTGLELSRTGDFTLASATVESQNGVLDTLGLGGILPLDVTKVELSGLNGQPITLERCRVDITGQVDMEVFQVFGGAHPVLNLGTWTLRSDDESTPLVDESEFTLGFILENGDLRAAFGDGEVTVGLLDVPLGFAELDATVTLGSFLNGEYRFDPLGITIKAVGDDDNLSLHALGHLSRDGGLTTLNFEDMALGFGFTRALGFISLQADDVAATFDMALCVGPGFEVDTSRTYVRLDNVKAVLLDIGIGAADNPLLRFSAENVTLYPEGECLLSIGDGGITASLPALGGLFAGLEGNVRNFSIGRDLSFVPSTNPDYPFGIEFSGIDSTAFGLPEWLPLDVSGFGVEFLDANEGEAGLQIALDKIILILSGRLGNDTWPINASVERLRINLEKLATGEGLAAFEGLDGCFVDFDIGGVKIGGGLGLSTVDYDGKTALYGGITGQFEVSGIGGGIDLFLSEYGPVVASLEIPLAIPLPPTPLMISGVTGGFRFGGELLDVPRLDPVEPGTLGAPDIFGLMHEQTTFDLLHVDMNSAMREVVNLLKENDANPDGEKIYTWNLPFTLAISGEIATDVPILTGTVNLAAQLGIGVDPNSPISFSLLGSGTLDVFGMPLGGVGVLWDFSDPLAPIYNLACELPLSSNPLSLFIPLKTDFGVLLDSTGMAQSMLVGLKTFVGKMIDGAVAGADGMLDALANNLDRERGRQLVTLLNLNNASVIDAEALKEALVAKLETILGKVLEPIGDNPSDARLKEVEAYGREAAQLVNALTQELFQAAGTALTDAGQRAAFLESLGETVKTATLAALQDGFEQFNPRLEIEGAMQPTLLGMPFGEPDQTVKLAIDKNGIVLGMGGSLVGMAGTYANLFTGGLPIGSQMVAMSTAGFKDYLSFEFKLGLGGIFQSILAGNGLPEINPLGDWMAGIEGSLSWMGFPIGEVSGYLFSAESNEIDAHVLREFDPGDSIGDIPIALEAQYQSLFDYGGLLMTGQLFAPALLVDPLAVIDAMTKKLLHPPESPLEYPDWIKNDLIAPLTASQELARMQFFVPSLMTLPEDVEWDKGLPGLQAALQKYQDEVTARLNSIYLTGFLAGEDGGPVKLLGIPLAKGRVDANSDGISASAELPWLLDVETKFDLHNKQLVVNQFVEDLAHQAGLLDLDLTNDQVPAVEVEFPVAAATATLDSARMADILEDTFGLPAAIINNAGNATASLGLYSPGYGYGDPRATQVERNGGVEFDARLDITNLLDDAAFHFEMPLFTDVVPDFTAHAHVTKLAVPGLADMPADLFSLSLDADLAKNNNVLSFGLDGEVNLLGKGFTVDGDLTVSAVQGGLWGSLALQASDSYIGNSLFSLTGALSLEINTTDQAHGGLRAEPYLGVHVEDGQLEVGGMLTVMGDFDLLFNPHGFDISVDGKVIGGLEPLTGTASLDVAGDFTYLSGEGFYGALTVETNTIDNPVIALDAQFELGMNSTAAVRGVVLDGQHVALPDHTLRMHVGGTTANTPASLSLKGLGLVADRIALAGEFDLTISNESMSLAVDAGSLSIDLKGALGGLDLHVDGALTVLAPGNPDALLGGLYGWLSTSTDGHYEQDFFDLSGSFGVGVNTTSAAQALGSVTLPRGPYLALHVDGTLSAFGGAVSLEADVFDFAVSSSSLSVDVQGSLAVNNIPVPWDDAGLDVALDVNASMTLAGGRVEGSFSTDGFEATLCRFGCIQGYLAMELPVVGDVELDFAFALPGGSCMQQVYLDDVWIEEGDTAWDYELPIGLSRAAERRVSVDYSINGGAVGTTIIDKGARHGIIWIPIQGNDSTATGDRDIQVTLSNVHYVADNKDDRNLPALALDDGDAVVHVQEDDFPLPVIIHIDETLVLSEGESGSLAVWAENLAANDRVRLSYAVLPRTAGLGTATMVEDFRTLGGSIELRGGDIQHIQITTYEDTLYELDESFRIGLTVTRAASYGAGTLLSEDRATVTILNDDNDHRQQALVFYDFDQWDSDAGAYAFTTDADLGLHGLARPGHPVVLSASDFRHRDDVPNYALSFTQDDDHVYVTRARPTVPALPNYPATIEFWMKPDALPDSGKRAVLFQTASGDLTLYLDSDGWIKGAVGGGSYKLAQYSVGQWQHVAVALTANGATAYVNGVRAISGGGMAIPTLADESGFYLGNDRNLSQPFKGQLEAFHIWGLAANVTQVGQMKSGTLTATTPAIRFDFDEGGGDLLSNAGSLAGWQARLGSVVETTIGGKTLSITSGRPDWRVVSAEANGPSMLGARSESEVSEGGIAKVWPAAPEADASHALAADNWWVANPSDVASRPYFSFSVGIDAPTFGGKLVAGQSAFVNGIDFFDRSELYLGPTAWELRSSQDGFASVLASGAASQTIAGYLHQREAFADTLYIKAGETVEFRLYGLTSYDAETGGDWTLDNVSLIGGLGSPGSAPTVADVTMSVPIDLIDQRLDVLAGVTDPDGDTAFVLDVLAPVDGSISLLENGAYQVSTANGTLLLTPSEPPGTYLLRPLAGVTGDLSVTFVVADDWLNTAEKTVTVHPLGYVWPDQFLTHPDQKISGNVLANDVLATGLPATTTVVAGSAKGGSVVLAADGGFSFTPLKGALSGEFSYRVTGQDMFWGVAKVSIDINDVPAAPNRFYAVSEDGSLSVPAGSGLLKSLADAQGDALTASWLPEAVVFGHQSTLHGTVKVNADGSFVYAPEANYSGSASFQYQVSDGREMSTGTVTITVNPVNDRPVAAAHYYEVREGGVLTVDADTGLLYQAVDIDSGRLKALLAGSGPSHGSVAAQADGSFVYTPVVGYQGLDRFWYKVSDFLSESDLTQVTVRVTNNRAPVAVNDGFTLLEDQSLPINLIDLLKNDSDPDGDVFSYNGRGLAPMHGLLTATYSMQNGKLVQTGLRYQPNQDYSGTDNFTYEIVDAYGKTATGTVTLTITPVNDSPIAKVGQSYTLYLSTGNTLNPAAPGVLTGASDAEGDALTAELITKPAHAANKGADFTLNANGSFSYRPQAGFTGDDSFIFRIRDSQGAYSEATTVKIVVSNIATTSSQSKLEKGYVDGAEVFLDANGNRLHDYEDLNGNGVFDAGEPGEPMMLTGPDGSGVILIPDSYDLDGSGVIEPLEGVLIARGGLQLATLQPLNTPLLAPVGAAVITPLTTLLTTLTLEQGLTVDAAQSAVVHALGLPAVDLTAFDPIAETASGNPLGPVVLASHDQVHILHLGVASLLHGAGAASLDVGAAALMGALAQHLAEGSGVLDLTDAAVIHELVLDTAARLGLVLDPAGIDAAVRILAELNQAVAAVPSTADMSYVEMQTRTESALQNGVAQDLAELGGGRLDADTALDRYTGAALQSVIQSAPLGAITVSSDGARILTLSATDVVEGGNLVLTGGLIGVNPAKTLQLLVNWGDGGFETIALPAGATQFQVEHAYGDDHPSGTSSDPLHIGVVLLEEGTGVDTAVVETSIHNAAPEIVEMAMPDFALVGQRVDLIAETFDLSPEDSLTLFIDWGDGLSETLLLGLTRPFSAGHVYMQAGEHVGSIMLTDDDNGSVTADFLITIGQNEVPEAGDDRYTLMAGAEIVVDAIAGLLSNDADAESRELSVSLLGGPLHGMLALNADGGFSYSPEAGYSGMDSFTYRASDGGLFSNPATVNLTVLAAFQITAFEQTDSGFHLGFNHAIDGGVLNLYSGVDDAPNSPMGVADLTLTDSRGNLVRGNLILDADHLGATYLKSDGILAAGDYNLRLSSRADGWRDTGGQLLDGNGDGTGGDDYTRVLSVAPSNSAIVSIGELALGAGQSIASTLGGLPITLLNGAGVSHIQFSLAYDSALLTITGASLGSGLTGSVDLSVAGLVQVNLSSAAPLGNSAKEVLRLEGDVPLDAQNQYGGKNLLHLYDVSLSNAGGGALATRVDDGLHVAAYVGDGNGDGTYTTVDATRLLRVLSRADTGYNLYPLVDPSLIGDVNNSHNLSTVDYALILREATYLASGNAALNWIGIPDLPGGVSITFAGADPLVKLPDNLEATAGGEITVPVLLAELESGLTSIPLETVTIRIAWNPGQLELLDWNPGSLTGDFGTVITHSEAGLLILDLSHDGAKDVGLGSLAELRFRVTAQASGTVRVDLQEVKLNASHLTLNPAPQIGADSTDGLIRVNLPIAPDRLAIPDSGVSHDLGATPVIDFGSRYDGFEFTGNGDKSWLGDWLTDGKNKKPDLEALRIQPIIQPKVAPRLSARV